MLNRVGSMIALFAAGKVAIGIKSVHVAFRVQLLEELGSSIAYLVGSSIIKAHLVFAESKLPNRLYGLHGYTYFLGSHALGHL